MIDLAKHARMANAVRFLAIDAVEQAKSGHPGLPMGAADVVTVLFSKFLKFDPTLPDWADRDRFVLSAGHGSMLIYALLHLAGYDDMTLDEIKRFRQLGSRTAGHPEYGHAAGIETTTGPLGQGLANAVGMAMAERHLATVYGKAVVDHKTYVLVGDGCLMEGIAQEAISLAGHLKLSKLIVLWDDNGISIDGAISLTDSTDQTKRFQASGWMTMSIDGHDPVAIDAALNAAQTADKPVMIACRTTIGYGAPTKAGKSAAHGSPLGKDEIAGARAALGWSEGPFEIPADVRDAWRLAALKRGHHDRVEWEKRFAALDRGVRAEFDRRMRGTVPTALAEAVNALKARHAVEEPKIATRKASEVALETIVRAVPEMIGGSADLTGSNNTKTKDTPAITPDDFSGRFVHWGIREHGMAAAMNGMALHGGVLPFSGTFLAFSDYCRPSIRLAALMGIRVVFVMTHDSIGLGEDGPTHQPVEHLAALRTIPNLLVLRPADAVETVECWQIALNEPSTPSVIALTRQNLPTLRKDYEEANRCARGAYEIAPADADAVVSLFATGSEVEIAVAAKRKLDAGGYPTRVVSVPSFELFARQSDDYRAEVIGQARVKIGVEAAIRMGWDTLIGSHGGFVGMTGFGASAPAEVLYEHFGITADAVAELAMGRVKASA